MWEINWRGNNCYCATSMNNEHAFGEDSDDDANLKLSGETNE